MSEFLNSPLVLIPVLAVIGLVFAIGKWVGGVNEHKRGIEQGFADQRKALSDFMSEIRNDIKNILSRLPPATVAGGSPLRLTELGQAVSDALDVSAWAERTAPTLSARTQGKQPHEIQDLCFAYIVEEFQPDEDMDTKINASAYENGIEREQVLRVLAIELRDKLLASHR